MIVIISPDKDFSHTLAEHVVHELEISCECIESINQLSSINNDEIQLLVSEEDLDQLSFPAIKLTLPVHMYETLSAIQNALQNTAMQTITLGNITFSPQSKLLKIENSKKTVDLTDKEASLMQTLIEAGEQGAEKDMLLEKIWGHKADMNTHTLETHIYRLRAKCKELCGDEMIEVIDGGYRLINKE